jgi:hypothetical protein
VKNVRLTTIVVCALYLKIQEVRGSSSYMGMALQRLAPTYRQGV